MATCRSCGAEIRWVRSARGKNMPIDAEPERRIVVAEIEGMQVGQIRDTFTPHWATCPNADEHRKDTRS
jgi:hypothetical protein